MQSIIVATLGSITIRFLVLWVGSEATPVYFATLLEKD